MIMSLVAWLRGPPFQWKGNKFNIMRKEPDSHYVRNEVPYQSRLRVKWLLVQVFYTTNMPVM